MQPSPSQTGLVLFHHRRHIKDGDGRVDGVSARLENLHPRHRLQWMLGGHHAVRSHDHPAARTASPRARALAPGLRPALGLRAPGRGQTWKAPMSSATGISMVPSWKHQHHEQHGYPYRTDELRCGGPNLELEPKVAGASKSAAHLFFNRLGDLGHGFRHLRRLIPTMATIGRPTFTNNLGKVRTVLPHQFKQVAFRHLRKVDSSESQSSHQHDGSFHEWAVFNPLEGRCNGLGTVAVGPGLAHFGLRLFDRNALRRKGHLKRLEV